MYRVQPAIVKEFGLSSSQFGFYVSLFFLVYAVVAFFAGVHSDHVVIVLLFWGLALNAVFPVFYAMIADHAPEATGSGMGLLLLLTFLGQVPATPLAGFLIDAFGGYKAMGGYVAGFAIAAALVAMALMWFGTRDVARRAGQDLTEPTPAS